MYENRLYPGIFEALEELTASGARLALATSKPWPLADRILDHFGLSGFFSARAGSEMDGTRTDKGEVVALALSLLGAGAKGALMVGDREHDILGGKKNGVLTAGVLYGYGGKAELEAAGADFLVASPAELVGLLQFLS